MQKPPLYKNTSLHHRYTLTQCQGSFKDANSSIAPLPGVHVPFISKGSHSFINPKPSTPCNKKVQEFEMKMTPIQKYIQHKKSESVDGRRLIMITQNESSPIQFTPINKENWEMPYKTTLLSNDSLKDYLKNLPQASSPLSLKKRFQ